MANTNQAVAEDRNALVAGFEPETVLPVQLLEKNDGAGMQPEKRLMLAVLEDAVACFQRGVATNGRAAAREFHEARSWFASDDVTWPYSFINIAHTLGFEPAYLRGGLERWANGVRERAAGGKVVPFRYAFRRISGSRTRAVVPRRLRNK